MSEEQYKKKKKMVLLSLFCTIAVMLVIGISYAFWQKTKVQEEANVIASACFDIELSGKNAIDLAETYPISNEDGMQTIPFTFTVKNICDYQTVYTVNLEALVATTFENNSVKVALDDNYKLYSEYTSTNKNFDDSKDARILTSGVLSKGQSKTYNLRLWIDENAPNTEQKKVFESKIIINSELSTNATNSDE